MNWGTVRIPAPLRWANRAPRAAAVLVLAMLALTGQAARAGIPPIVVNTPARATVLQPLTFLKIDDMSFGWIIPATTAGTVTVSAITGNCTTTGAVVEVGTCQRARFAGMGARNMMVRVSLTSVTNLTGPGQTMVLNAITLDNDSTLAWQGNGNSNGHGVGLTQGNGNQRYRIVHPSGIFNLYVGGTLRVNANQAPGHYQGSVTITVQYQ